LIAQQTLELLGVTIFYKNRIDFLAAETDLLKVTSVSILIMWGIIWGKVFLSNKKALKISSQVLDFSVVAGVGFEPTTFGL
jgi:uncharacterized membrane protein